MTHVLIQTSSCLIMCFSITSALEWLTPGKPRKHDFEHGNRLKEDTIVYSEESESNGCSAMQHDLPSTTSVSAAFPKKLMVSRRQKYWMVFTVNTSSAHLKHLLVLVGVSSVVAIFLIYFYEWGILSSFSLSVTVTVQVNNIKKPFLTP